MRQPLRRPLALLLAALLAAVTALGLGLLAGCGDDDEPASGSTPSAAPTAAGGLTVFAAASLTDVLQAARPGESYNFAGSDQLALQIREGAPADVFVSANTRFPNELFDEGLLEEPAVFATNKLVLIAPEANPAGITSLEDLAKDGVKLVLAEEGVPVGDYSREALTTLNLPAALDNVVSNEDDVKAVVGKVALGEADAGFCYFTDVKPVEDDVTVIEVPASAQPTIEYGVGVVKASANAEAARAFVAFLLSPEGQGFLTDHNFGLPTP